VKFSGISNFNLSKLSDSALKGQRLEEKCVLIRGDENIGTS